MNIDFDALYRNHYPRVFGLCLRMLGQRTRAEDATQEVFVRAYRALDRYDTSQPFDGWVLTIASRYCIDQIRRSRREPMSFDDGDDLAGIEAEAPPVLDTLVEAEQDAGLRAAIEALPDRYRVPIVLAYYSEWSYERIAEELGITRNHVGVLLLRARQALRSRLTADRESPR